MGLGAGSSQRSPAGSIQRWSAKASAAAASRGWPLPAQPLRHSISLHVGLAPGKRAARRPPLQAQPHILNHRPHNLHALAACRQPSQRLCKGARGQGCESLVGCAVRWHTALDAARPCKELPGHHAGLARPRQQIILLRNTDCCSTLTAAAGCRHAASQHAGLQLRQPACNGPNRADLRAYGTQTSSQVGVPRSDELEVLHLKVASRPPHPSAPHETGPTPLPPPCLPTMAGWPGCLLVLISSWPPQPAPQAYSYFVSPHLPQQRRILKLCIEGRLLPQQPLEPQVAPLVRLVPRVHARHCRWGRKKERRTKPWDVNLGSGWDEMAVGQAPPLPCGWAMVGTQRAGSW